MTQQFPDIEIADRSRQLMIFSFDVKKSTFTQSNGKFRQKILVFIVLCSTVIYIPNIKSVQHFMAQDKRRNRW